MSSDILTQLQSRINSVHASLDSGLTLIHSNAPPLNDPAARALYHNEVSIDFTASAGICNHAIASAVYYTIRFVTHFAIHCVWTPPSEHRPQ